MLSFFFSSFLFLSFLPSFLLSFPPRSIDLRQETQSEKHSIPISIELSSHGFSPPFILHAYDPLFFYICSGQPRFASTRKNLLVLQRKRGIKDWYLLYIYVKSYFSREIRGLRCTYRIVFLSFSSSLSFFLVQLHVRYHGCIKIFNFIQTDAAIHF